MHMSQHANEIVKAAEVHVKEALGEDGSGHDWQHVDRVRRMALRIAEEEGADPFVVELAALLHDIADWKFRGGDEEAGPREARAWMEEQGVPESVMSHVCSIIRGVSFRGAGVLTPMNTKEGMAVQDADRLDAIGAIGIARAFLYGGSRGHAMYRPGEKPELHASFEEYRNKTGSVIAHFSEKLLLLKDRMHTDAAQRIAEERHAFMEQFLSRFHDEREGRA